MFSIGTFIAVDQLLRMADNPSFQEIDIFNLVNIFRIPKFNWVLEDGYFLWHLINQNI